ncbi:MAG: ATP-binding protein [Telluria sp.]
MFTTDAQVMRWEAELATRRGPARLELLVCLAWHLRQREQARALALAEEALELLPAAGLAPAAAGRVRLRLGLVSAEAHWLGGALDAALDEAEALRQRCAQAGDGAGCADAHWLLAWICIDRGEHGRSASEFAAAAVAARAAGDAVRAAIADAGAARWAVLRDRSSAVAQWQDRLDHRLAETQPALAVWVHDYHALAASEAADFGSAAEHFLQCYEAALETGQLRAAIIAATNIGEDFSMLNDHHAALEWMQCALDLARPTGWPRSVGACLMHTADTLRRLGQLDAAHELLQEALVMLQPLANARSYAIALQYLGDLSLDQRDYLGALNAFRRLEERAAALDQSDFRSVARRGQAHALSELDRPAEALGVAESAVALAAAQGHASHHIAALRVLALIHARHRGLPAPPGMTAANCAVHYLRMALDVAARIEGYTVPGELYDALGREYAQLGSHAEAYEMALLAAAAREKTHSQEATNRAIAMRVHHQTEHARSEGLHHRELAASEARRAELASRTSAMLERLSAIGQEITAHLDAAAVFHALDRHIHGLLPATTFAIYLTDPSGTMLMRAFGVEQGKPLPDNAIALDDPTAYSVRCLKERRELVINKGPEEEAPPVVVPGTVANRSALFAPLLAGERALGVMTVQAEDPFSYGEQERMIFRTLCAYGAIALDNAQTYAQLQDAQVQLVEQEKLAALGALMAGIAHELNTPIGNSLLIASTLQEKTAAIEGLMNGPGIKKSDLVNFIADAQKAATLVMRGLTSAAHLVNSFKQVAVDRTTEQRRGFNLHQVCHELAATMHNRVRQAGHTLEVEVGESIFMDSYPGPFGQVITNFINNALLHAFDGRQNGAMHMAARLHGEGRVLVEFRDNGGGIPSEHLGRIFDPFFTTKLGQGGSGLGLSISYNIVTSLLGGQITVDSAPGTGTCFALDLPLTAPEHAPAEPPPFY